MKTDRNLFLKTVFSAAVLALAPFFCAAAAVESEYWRGAEELREGVKVKVMNLFLWIALENKVAFCNSLC